MIHQLMENVNQSQIKKPIRKNHSMEYYTMDDIAKDFEQEVLDLCILSKKTQKAYQNISNEKVFGNGFYLFDDNLSAKLSDFNSLAAETLKKSLLYKKSVHEIIENKIPWKDQVKKMELMTDIEKLYGQDLHPKNYRKNGYSYDSVKYINGDKNLNRLHKSK